HAPPRARHDGGRARLAAACGGGDQRAGLEEEAAAGGEHGPILARSRAGRARRHRRPAPRAAGERYAASSRQLRATTRRSRSRSTGFFSSPVASGGIGAPEAVTIVTGISA